jgi:hypothetical protein
MMIEQEEWTTVPEAAKHFGVSAQKIKRTIREHDLEERKDEMDKRRVVVKLADLQRLYGRQ